MDITTGGQANNKMVRLITLPFPPSVNGLFGGGSKQKRFPSAAYKKWLKTLPELVGYNDTAPCHIHYTYYWPDKRVRDGQNYMKAPLDYLCKQDIIDDDKWQIVASESWSHDNVDKENPRVEITIVKLKEGLRLCSESLLQLLLAS